MKIMLDKNLHFWKEKIAPEMIAAKTLIIYFTFYKKVIVPQHNNDQCVSHSLIGVRHMTSEHKTGNNGVEILYNR